MPYPTKEEVRKEIQNDYDFHKMLEHLVYIESLLKFLHDMISKNFQPTPKDLIQHLEDIKSVLEEEISSKCSLKS